VADYLGGAVSAAVVYKNNLDKFFRVSLVDDAFNSFFQCGFAVFNAYSNGN